MNRNVLLTTICLSILFASCVSTPPEKYFEIAVLNTNMLQGFAAEGLNRELESPSVKADPDAKEGYTQMTRKEAIGSKLQYLEESFEKINKLKQTDDTRDIVERAKALYTYVLPVYKNEYYLLAKVYDDGGSKEQIQLLTQQIHDKHHTKFDELYGKLILSGKAYATRHNIKVNWAD